jgi:hypothetical protein
MAERKVLCKYYPPDFDPIKLTKIKKIQDQKIKEKQLSEMKKRGVSVRMMLPMSVRCKTCGEFMKIGTKFNMRKETVEEEDYLGIAIYRFYWKCSRCSGELTMKTDPKNSDYICEYGATRNYCPFQYVKKLDFKDDEMKKLENKMYDSKREMDILDNLEEVRDLNKRHANVNHEEMIEASRKRHMESLQEDVLQKDAREQYSKLVRKRADLIEEEQRELENIQEEESSDEDDGLGIIMNVKKRDVKGFLKPNIVTPNTVFKKPALKIVEKQKEDDAKTKKDVSVNPLDMYADSDSD